MATMENSGQPEAQATDPPAVAPVGARPAARATARGFIDIHAHILPGLDDGATDLDESLAMARIAVHEGVGTMLTTSHSAECFERGPQQWMLDDIQNVQRALDEANIPLTLQPGMEIFLTPETLQDLAIGRAWGLAGSHYILVEVPFRLWPPYIEPTLFELQVAGYIPILAHPERYSIIQRDPNMMYILAERGILGQVTAEALNGSQGTAAQRCAMTLVEHGLVQFIASDGHGEPLRKRRPVVAAGLAIAANLVGDEAARAMLTTNPQQILDDVPLVIDPEPIEQRRSIFDRLFNRGPE